MWSFNRYKMRCTRCVMKLEVISAQVEHLSRWLSPLKVQIALVATSFVYGTHEMGRMRTHSNSNSCLGSSDGSTVQSSMYIKSPNS